MPGCPQIGIHVEPQSALLCYFICLIDFLELCLFSLKDGSHSSPSWFLWDWTPDKFLSTWRAPLVSPQVSGLSARCFLIHLEQWTFFDGSLVGNLSSSATLGPGSPVGWSLNKASSHLRTVQFVPYNLVMSCIYWDIHQIEMWTNTGFKHLASFRVYGSVLSI